MERFRALIFCFDSSIFRSASEIAVSQGVNGFSTFLDKVLDKFLDMTIILLVTDDYYKTAFESALSELSGLIKERMELRAKLETIEDRIERVRQGALGLVALLDVDFEEVRQKYPGLFDEQLDPRIGITEAVREALKSANTLLTPVEVKERVIHISPAIAGHKNPMASVHAILRRLNENGDAVSGTTNDGKTLYGWTGGDDEDTKARIQGWFPEAWKQTYENIMVKKRARGGGFS
jgi:hypothetical protein